MALGQVSVGPTPVPRIQFLSPTGVPLAGGKVQTYTCGTTTPLTSYTDSTGGTPNANPVILDSGGFAGIWLGPSCYKFLVKDSADVTQWTVDGIKSPTGSLTVATLTTTGAVTIGGALSATTSSFSGLMNVGTGTVAQQPTLDPPPSGPLEPQVLAAKNGTVAIPTTGLYLSKPDTYFGRNDATTAASCVSGLFDACSAPIVRIDGNNPNTTTMSTQIGLAINLWGYKANTQSATGNTVLGIVAATFDTTTPNIAHMFGSNFITGVQSVPTQLFGVGLTRAAFSSQLNIQNLNKWNISPTGAVRATNVVTITTTVAHRFPVGATVLIAGVTNTSFNGSFTIASTPLTTTFTYSQTAGDASSGNGTAGIPCVWNGVIGNYCGGMTIVGNGVSSDWTAALIVDSSTVGTGFRHGLDVAGVKEVGVIVLPGVAQPVINFSAEGGGTYGYSVGCGTVGVTAGINANHTCLNATTGVLLDANGVLNAAATKNSHKMVFRSTDATPTPYDWTLYQDNAKILHFQAGGADAFYADNVGNLVAAGGFTAGTSTMAITGTTGLITKYGNINTVQNGVPSEYAAVNLTGQGAAITTTTLYAVPASGAGQYRVSWNAKVTTADGVSSTLGALTLVYTDPDSVVQTITAPASVAAGTIATTSTGNSTTTVLLGLPLTLNCKASTNVTYAMAYVSNTPGQMQYNIHIILEKL